MAHEGLVDLATLFFLLNFAVNQPVTLHITSHVVLVTVFGFANLLGQSRLLTTPHGKTKTAGIFSVEINAFLFMLPVCSSCSGIRRRLLTALVSVVTAVRAIKLNATGKHFHIASFAIRWPCMNIEVDTPTCNVKILNFLIHFCVCHVRKATAAREDRSTTPFRDLQRRVGLRVDPVVLRVRVRHAVAQIMAEL